MLNLCVSLGQYNEETLRKKEKQLEEEKALAESTVIGSRCKVSVPNMSTKLGTAMYAGPIEGLTGYWVGVKYDEPLGKNDGSYVKFLFSKLLLYSNCFAGSKGKNILNVQ